MKHQRKMLLAVTRLNPCRGRINYRGTTTDALCIIALSFLIGKPSTLLVELLKR